MKKSADKDQCDLVAGLRKVGSCWKLLLLRELMKGPWRFSEFRRNLPGISSTSLARGLRELEMDGLISRTVIGARPPIVKYKLLHNDPHLRKAIEHLTRWGRQFNLRKPDQQT